MLPFKDRWIGTRSEFEGTYHCYCCSKKQLREKYIQERLPGNNPVWPSIGKYKEKEGVIKDIITMGLSDTKWNS